MSIDASDCSSYEMQLNRRYKKLLLSEDHSDCVFLIGDIRIRCHKLILSCASPVFDAMFYGSMREKEAIEICDINAETFQKLIYYVYTAQIDLDSDSIEDIFELCYSAEKYLLNDLINICLNAVKRKLRFDNVLPALELCLCTNLKPLLQICMNFFTQCCENNLQFMIYIKNNYIHISKDCIKTIIDNSKNLKYSLWFIWEWCQHECNHLGLQQNEYDLVFNDLQIDMSKISGSSEKISEEMMQYCSTIERIYYKACRPYTISPENCESNINIQSNRRISLYGLVINSRLKPNSFNKHSLIQNEYRESFQIQIRSQLITDNKSNLDTILQHFVDNDCTKYNCSLNIMWKNAVILLPDIKYNISLIWYPSAFGAEYPCSVQSSEVDGISFTDISPQFGSFVKGLKYINI